VPLANIGSGIGMTLFVLGLIFSALHILLYVGIALYSAVVFFQVVNLPVEFNASSRAKAQLVQLGIIDNEGLYYVNKVLSAAALTYVAATLQAIMTLLYLLMRFNQRERLREKDKIIFISDVPF
jgi:Zn-dependent membrane protease YugP